MGLRPLPIDVNFARFTRLLRLGPRTEEACDVEPDIQADGVHAVIVNGQGRRAKGLGLRVPTCRSAWVRRTEAPFSSYSAPVTLRCGRHVGIPDDLAALFEFHHFVYARRWGSAAGAAADPGNVFAGLAVGRDRAVLFDGAGTRIVRGERELLVLRVALEQLLQISDARADVLGRIVRVGH